MNKQTRKTMIIITMITILIIMLQCAFAPPLTSQHYQNVLGVFFHLLGVPEGAVNATQYSNLTCPSTPGAHVACDANGYVSFNIASVGATGELAVGLLLHVDVRRIDVSANQITNTSTIMVSNFNTTAFGNALQYVDLSRNRLVDWPHAFDSLSRLTHFDLSGNLIDGPVPDLSLWNDSVQCTLMKPGASETNTFCRSLCVPRGPPSCFLNVPLCPGVTCPTSTTTTTTSTAAPSASTTLGNSFSPNLQGSDSTSSSAAPTSDDPITTTTTTTTAAATAKDDSAIIDADDTLPIILGIAGGVLLTGIVVTIAAIYIFRASAKRSERRATMNGGAGPGTQLRSAPDPPSGSYNSSSVGRDSVGSDPVSQSVPRSQINMPSSTQSSEYYRIDQAKIESAYERAPLESSTYDSSTPLTNPPPPKFDDEEFAAQAYGV
jgi:hypothetical protein